MAGDELSGRARVVAEAYATAVTERLDAPADLLVDIRDEVADGLSLAIEDYCRRGLSPDEAARAAIAEFGEPNATAVAFGTEVRLARARRTGLALMVTGPVVGLLWISTALIAGLPARLPAGMLLWAVLAVVALAVAVGAGASELAVAATGRLSRRLGRPGLASASAMVACGAALIADVTILSGVCVYALTGPGSLGPLPVVAAVLASLLRMSFTGRVVIRSFARIDSPRS